MRNIVLFGPPGSGKGTQSQELMRRYQLVHIAPGDLLRAQVKMGTLLGQQVAEYINEGQLAPQSLVTDIVMNKVNSHPDAAGFLFDGFPRTLAQADALETKMLAYGYRIDAAILLEVPEQVLLDRIQVRAQTAGRADDQDVAKVARRMQVYRDETLPIIQYYKQQQKLFRADGLGTTPEVYERIVSIIDGATTQQ